MQKKREFERLSVTSHLGLKSKSTHLVFSQVFFEHFFYLLCQMACPIWRIENLIIEDGKVECQTQSDRMRSGHFRLGYVKCLLVCLLRVFYCSCLWFAVANKRDEMEKKEKKNIVNISIGMCTYGNYIIWLGNTHRRSFWQVLFLVLVWNWNQCDQNLSSFAFSKKLFTWSEN